MTRSPQWGELPELVLSNIYEHLSLTEILKASGTCRQWRNVIFRRRLFKTFKFKIHLDDDQKIKFFLNFLIKLTTEVCFIFNARNIFHIQKLKLILSKINKCDQIVGLCFQIDHNDLAIFGAHYPDEDNRNIKQLLIDPVKIMLNRTIPSFKRLDLGFIEQLTLHSNDLIKSLYRPQDLKELHIASVKYDPREYKTFTLETVLFEKLTSLEVLSLDYDVLTDDLLCALMLLPLKKFIICVHDIHRISHSGIKDVTWAAFSNKFKNIELYLYLIHAYEAVDKLQEIIFRQNMPLTHIRVVFCKAMNLIALDFLSLYYNETLKSVKWIDAIYNGLNNNKMNLCFQNEHDPFVMMAWRCKNLEEIVIHGYVIDPYNLVGISRLRGRNLKNLEISMIEESPMANIKESLLEDISSQLGQKWHPLTYPEIHPALFGFMADDDLRNKYIMELLRSDLSN